MESQAKAVSNQQYGLEKAPADDGLMIEQQDTAGAGALNVEINNK